ncbi:MAG: Rv2175c family DNA-binding protein [Leucobacter sp.]
MAENNASQSTAPANDSYFTIPDLVDRFGISPGRLHRLIEDHALAAVRIDGVLRIPVEFVVDDQPLPTLRGTLLVLLDAGFTEAEAVSWLLAENEELGERPVDALHAGRKSAVRRATQALAF